MNEKKKKVYISSSFVDKEVAFLLATMFEYNDIIVTRKWWNETGDLNEYENYFKDDVNAVKFSDAFIMYHSGKLSVGKFFEAGVAYSYAKPMYLIGNQLISLESNIPTPFNTPFKYFGVLNGTNLKNLINEIKR